MNENQKANFDLGRAQLVELAKNPEDECPHVKDHGKNKGVGTLGCFNRKHWRDCSFLWICAPNCRQCGSLISLKGNFEDEIKDDMLKERLCFQCINLEYM